MEKPVSRRAFVAAAGSAAVAATGLAAWNAARRVPGTAARTPVAAGAPAPVGSTLIDVDGWLLTTADVEALPEDRDWILETQ